MGAQRRVPPCACLIEDFTERNVRGWGLKVREQFSRRVRGEVERAFSAERTARTRQRKSVLGNPSNLV